MTTQTNQIATIKQEFNFLDIQQLETLQRVCKMFASSELVPDMYRASEKNPMDKAVANCMIAIEIATRIGASPLMVMQNMVPIYGKPSWSSKFLIATINSCGRFEPLEFDFIELGELKDYKYTEYESTWDGGRKSTKLVNKVFKGPVKNMQCIAFTTKKGSKSILKSPPVTVQMAIDEGWYTKKGSKWPNMTQLMLTYRAASFWVSLYAPELSMGMKTSEEVVDIGYEDVTFEKSNEEIQSKANKEEVGFDEEDEKPEEVKKAETPATSEEATKEKPQSKSNGQTKITEPGW